MDVKRMAGNYEITCSILIGDKEIVLGENLQDTDGVPYMCAYCESNDIFVRYYDAVGSDDYAEVVETFGARVKEQAEKTRAEMLQERKSGIEDKVITAKDCLSITHADDLNNKVVVIKAEILRPEYRSIGHQLKLCNGGFGASPNSRGSACFCTDLRTGKESRFERWDILGVLDESALPQWAKEGLASIKQAEANKHAKSKEDR